MRDIEKLCADNFSFTLPDGQKTSTPQIDWMWYNASDIFHGKEGKKKIKKYGKKNSYRWNFVFVHVSFPHVITIITGIILFYLSIIGVLGIPL